MKNIFLDQHPISLVNRMSTDKIKLFFIVIFCLSVPVSFAQNKNIDSLLTLLKTDKADINKVTHLSQIVTEYKLIGDYEKGLSYGTKALELARKLNFKKGTAQVSTSIGNIYLLQTDYSLALVYYRKALMVNEELKNKKEIATCLRAIGGVYISQADYPLALNYLLKSLKINEEIKNKEEIANCYSSMGNVYMYQADYPMALNYYLKALKLYEMLKKQEKITTCLSNIGIIYLYQIDYPKALGYYLKALKMAEEFGYKQLKSKNLNNIGIIYQQQEDYPNALDYYFKAQQIMEELDDKNGIATNLSNIGNCLSYQGDYPKALNYYFKALKMTEELGDKNKIAICLANISDLYTSTGKFKEAEPYLKRAIAIEDSIGSLDYLMQFEVLLSEIYDTTGRHKEALIHYKKAIALKDTIFSQENKKELVRKEMNYEFDKKEAITKAENEKQNAIAEEKNRLQKIVIWSVTGGFLLVVVFAGLIFRSLRITRKQKNIIELQKNEVSRQKDIADELRVISEKQKHIVEEKQKEIVDSITYARRIQRALLTSDEYIKTHLPAEHFILFKPKDIVSGDFYWAYLKQGTSDGGWTAGHSSLFYIATADCTGHGVPGAFMSMLNISYFNENVIERGIRMPNDVLDAQRKEIIQALNPMGSIEESKDGMDCVLCVYDFDKMLLHFAAANNPLWLVRNGVLREYKADKMPVGKFNEDVHPFTLQTIELQKGDTIYTPTDGFADQFGTNGKKLMKKRFKEELLKINQRSMAEQKQHLDQFFETWKGNNEQVDDVCIIGVRI
ncbi:MAG: tetratricopeptide repeat protein [Bacteroidota bacterium]|nr:tetratricopeptide repeat protein [Bacteroidota bacterium]